MKVLAILQNQWFHDPDKVKRLLERTPKARRRIITYSLFAGCRTGRELMKAFGEPRCREIVWEEASPEIGGKASSCFPADPAHLRAVLDEVKPDIVLAFGRIAANGLAPLVNGHDLVIGPHPTARQSNTPDLLKRMAETLENMIRHRSLIAMTDKTNMPDECCWGGEVTYHCFTWGICPRRTNEAPREDQDSLHRGRANGRDPYAGCGGRSEIAGGLSGRTARRLVGEERR